MTRIDPQHDALWVTTLWGKLFGKAHYYPAGWNRSMCGAKVGIPKRVWDAGLEQPGRPCKMCVAFIEYKKSGTA